MTRRRQAEPVEPTPVEAAEYKPATGPATIEHPSFPRITKTVPADKLDAWLTQGWKLAR